MPPSHRNTDERKAHSKNIDNSIKSTNRFFVTTPIHHPLSTPTIGQTYPYVLADVLARFAGLMGKEIYLLAGTDEFGLAMVEVAKSNRLSPTTFAERNSDRFQRYWRSLGVNCNNFVRTTEKSHTNAVQDILRRLWRTGDIFGKLPDIFSRHELVRSARQSEYCFRLSKYHRRIVEHIRRNPNFIQPTVARDKAIQLLSNPMPEPLVSRAKLKYNWGVELPFAQDRIVYAWLAGLISYLAPLIGPQGERKEIWPPDLQIISLDLIQTHAIYWPAILMALNLDLPHCILFYKCFDRDCATLTAAASALTNAPDNVDELRGLLSRHNAFSGNIRDSAVDKDPARVRGLLTKLEQIVDMLVEQQRTNSTTYSELMPTDERLREVLGNLIRRSDKRLAKFRINLLVEDCHSAADELLMCMQRRFEEPAEFAHRLETSAECAASICSLLHPIMPGRMSYLWDRIGMPAEPSEYLYRCLKYRSG